jgi:hypothetical protein
MNNYSKINSGLFIKEYFKQLRIAKQYILQCNSNQWLECALAKKLFVILVTIISSILAS